ncbi:hypothetical protein FRC00_011940 [Tulasnella sp. 408]|nr:hypothetical protein FRC00_011940 [Tulasnella sp. 408]
MTGLQSLRIQGLKHNQPTLLQLHTIISSSPELEVLALTFWEWEAAGSAPTVPSLYPIALNSLKTLILDSINPVVVEGLSSIIIAPKCNNLKLHRVGGNMVHDQLTASRFVHLLRGPLREASGLFLDYNQPRGEIIFGAKEEEEGSDELGIRAATSKLAKRRRLYFNVSLGSAVQKKSRVWNDLMRTAMRNVFQPALSGLQLPIEFKLRGPPLHPTRVEESQELPYAIFLELPLTISLLLFNILATNSILDCLASPQHLSNADGDTGSLARPGPRLEKITILCSKESFKNAGTVISAAANLKTIKIIQLKR